MSRIRLIRQDNQVIELDATSYALNVSRSVPVIPIPILAERLAIDINAVQTDIQIDCILRDDDCSATSFQQDAAFCSIDFGLSAETSGGGNDFFMTGDGGAITIADLHDKTFELATAYTNKSRVRAPITIKFNKNSSSHSYSSSGSPILTIGIQSVSTGADLATRVVAAFAVNGTFNKQLTSTGSTGDTILDALTITAGAGSISSTGNSKVTITSVELGPDGNNATPNFNTETPLTKPKFELFGGGTLHNCKSAGDKLQDLIAAIGNANLAGASGALIDVGLDNESDEHGLDTSFSIADRSGDYIVGIQIPYNSLVQKTTADTSNDGYVTRNLLIVTGARSIEEQGSIGNYNEFGTDFNVRDKFTGIRGTVVGMNFGYDAGMNIYEGSVTFQPIDMIVGL